MSRPYRRTLLSRLLISTALPLAVLAAGTARGFAQNVVTATGTDGTPDSGENGGPANADNGFTTPNLFSWNQAFATGGLGGSGASGAVTGGAGGQGGFAQAEAV